MYFAKQAYHRSKMKVKYMKEKMPDSFKIAMKDEVYGNNNCNWCSWNCPEGLMRLKKHL